MNNPLSTASAAEMLECSRQRVAFLLASGTLTGRKFSGVWMIDGDSVERYRLSRSVGRPPNRAPSSN